MKNNIKKYCLIIFVMFPFLYANGQTDITVTVSSHSQIEDGTEVEVEVIVSGIPDGVYLDGFNGTFSWDNRYLTYVSANDVQGATDFNIGNENVYAEFTSGRSFLVSATGHNITNGAIMKWTFVYHGNGSGLCGLVRVDDNLVDVLWLNSEWGEWTAELVSGEVCGITTNLNQQTNTSNRTYIFPNPVIDNLNVKLYSDEMRTVNLSIADLLGRNVIELGTKSISQGVSDFCFPVEGLTPGIYFLQIQNTNTKDFKHYKFMIE